MPAVFSIAGDEACGLLYYLAIGSNSALCVGQLSQTSNVTSGRLGNSNGDQCPPGSRFACRRSIFCHNGREDDRGHVIPYERKPGISDRIGGTGKEDSSQ